MNSSFYLVLAVCVAVALASDSRTEKQIAYVNTYGQVAGLHRYVAADGYNYYNQQQPYYQSAYPYNQQYYQPQAYQYNSNPTQYYGQYSQQYNSLPYDYRQNAYGYQSYPSYGTVINRQAPPYPSPGAQPISPPVPHPFYHTQGTYYPTVITEKPSGPKNST